MGNLKAFTCVYVALFALQWFSSVVGLSLFCFRFISVAPVRGGTYFSLHAAKKSRQKKAAQTADMTPGVNRDRFFSFSNSYLSEFPEGDVAVHLDGGSR